MRNVSARDCFQKKLRFKMSLFEKTAAFDKKSGYLNVVIDTPKGAGPNLPSDPSVALTY